MSVKLISYTQTTDNKSITDLICYCARVSNPTNQELNENNDRLINYLIKNKHWSPFEMVNICLEIRTTRDIARQILRHRSFTFQEFSQRYAEVNQPFIIREARTQDIKNRQNSNETDDIEIIQEWLDIQYDVKNSILQLYNKALEIGIAKEQARAILPEGMTPSTIYVNGTLRSWIHYIDLRSKNGTQKEHKEIAILCSKEISSIFPYINNFI